MLRNNTTLANLRSSYEKDDKKSIAKDIWSEFVDAEWVNVKEGRKIYCRLGLPDNTVSLSTVRNSGLSHPELTNYYSMRISENIIKDLGWSEGDFIFVGQSPTSDLNFYFKKLTNSVKGFRLIKHLKRSGDRLLTFHSGNPVVMRRLQGIACEYFSNPKDSSLIVKLTEDFTPLLPSEIEKFK